MTAHLSRFVVDASVAIKWLFDDEDYADQAQQVLLDYQEGRIDLLAPDHLYHEVLNAPRTGVRMERIPAEHATGAVQDFLDLGIRTVSGRYLFIVGFEYALRYGCAFYDGLYLALADQTGCPLVHADRRLRNTLQDQFRYELWVGDYRPA